MKYIEQIKSAILLFLVLLSATLTIMIWTYKPVYPMIEDNNAVKEVSIGEKRELKDILKPYRILANTDDQLKGTVSSKMLDDLVNMMQNWEIEDFSLLDNDFTSNQMNEVLRENNRLVFMYNTTVPLNQFKNVLRFTDQELPQASFNRIVIDWNELDSNNNVKLFFLNTENSTAYRADVKIAQKGSFRRVLEESIKNYVSYTEIEREDELSLYLSVGNTEAIEYEYYIDEIQVEVFKKILFPGNSIVDRSDENSQSERYTDSIAIMEFDKQGKVINYVYPTAEGVSDMSPGKLLRDSFDFINEHGGFTTDYRFSAMNVEKHITEYQLFVQGAPVYSNTIATKIVTTWGDDRIFRYRHPYYSLDIGGQTIKELPSSEQVLEYIQNDDELDLNSIDDLVIGYYLTQNEELRLFKLEPSWFMIKGNGWIRITQEDIRGAENGLE